MIMMIINSIKVEINCTLEMIMNKAPRDNNQIERCLVRDQVLFLMLKQAL